MRILTASVGPSQLFVIFAVLFVYVSLYLWNLYYQVQQKEAPLDHLLSTVKKPFYRTCPEIPVAANESLSSAITTKWSGLTNSTPPFIMISARPREKVEPIVQSWMAFVQPLSLKLTVFSTRNISDIYVNKRCHHWTWSSRLFAVYHHVMEWALLNSTSTFFVFLEDDVVLRMPIAFGSELQWAIHQELDYYSFFRTPPVPKKRNRTSCLYQWGTQAQLISRKMINRILRVNDDRFCRLPIDMYLAQQGPWYVTQRQLVEHVGIRS